MACHHCSPDRDRGYLRHELQEHAGIAMGVWFLSSRCASACSIASKRHFELQIGVSRRALGSACDVVRQRPRNSSRRLRQPRGVCRCDRALVSSVSSRTLARTARGSLQCSNPTPACSSLGTSRTRAGRRGHRPRPRSAAYRRGRFSWALMRSNGASTAFGGLAFGVGEHVRTTRPLSGDRLHDVGKIEGALLLSHAGVENDLQKQIAKLVFQAGKIVTAIGVGDLHGFFERIGRDGAEILFEVPRTSGAGRTQRRRGDLDQRGMSAGGFAGSSTCGGWGR